VQRPKRQLLDDVGVADAIRNDTDVVPDRAARRLHGTGPPSKLI
jgi:hypothetical protein